MISVVVFKIVGLSPILMNNPKSMNEDSDSKGGAKASTKKSDPEKEAGAALYVDKDGTFYVPSIAFRNSLWEGSSFMKVGKETARSRIAAGVFTVEDTVTLLDKDTGNPVTEWEIDTRTVVIKATGGRIVRHRPKISNWMCNLPLELDDDFVQVDLIEKLFNRAGKVIGVMDYRPAKRGWFGRYQVEVPAGKAETGGVEMKPIRRRGK